MIDKLIAGSFLQLTNYFAANFDSPCQSVSSLAELWQKQGVMMARMMQCDTDEFESSELFYNVLQKKLMLSNGELATALNVEKAASGDIFEICKFYALYLEFLRQDHSEMLTQVLETLAKNTGFNSSSILDIFSFFDSLYSSDVTENWWSCLESKDPFDMSSETFSTPKKNQTMIFATPTATARRLRTVASTARRSPIAEAVDSPTMKFLRAEQLLKQTQRKNGEMQQTLEELDSENQKLVEANRELKLAIRELQGSAADNRDTARSAKQMSIELSAALEEKRLEVDSLTRQLDESRVLIRTEHRHLEELEVEKEKLASKIVSVIADRDACMKQMRELRSANEEEFSVWREKEIVLLEKIRVANQQNQSLLEQLTGLEEMRDSLRSENSMKASTIEDVSLTASRYKQEADNAQSQLKEEKEQYQKTVLKMQEEHVARIRMAEEKMERLEKQLKEERDEKSSLQTLFDELNAKALVADQTNHDHEGGVISMRMGLEMAKRRIEQLELEVQSKETASRQQKEQCVRLNELLATEETIREKATRKHEETVEKLNELETKIGEQTKKWEGERIEKEEMIALLKEEVSKLNGSSEELKEKLVQAENRNSQFVAKIKVYNKKPDCFRREFIKPNLFEMLEKEFPDIDTDLCSETTLKKATSFGTQSSRASLRSDTFSTISTPSGFKAPFTPNQRVLGSRNENLVQPDFNCDTISVDSSNADDEKRMGAGTVKPKKRRESLVSILTMRNKK